MSRAPERAPSRGYAGRHRRPTPSTGRVASRGIAVASLSVGLLVTGMTATGTASAAESKTSSQTAAVAKRPLLKYGSRGSAVVYVQRRLGVRPVSGWYGPKTRAAVKRYQRANGIRPTGMVGPKTWASLLGKPRASRSTKRVATNVASLNWRALARCESGGNPRAVNPSGRYFGLYQFDLRTWRSVGGSGYPHRATAAEQTRRAQMLYADRGARPWPTCGKLLFT